MDGSCHLDSVFAWVLRSSGEASVIVGLVLLTQLLLKRGTTYPDGVFVYGRKDGARGEFKQGEEQRCA
jgi:hypothetical protein